MIKSHRLTADDYLHHYHQAPLCKWSPPCPSNKWLHHRLRKSISDDNVSSEFFDIRNYQSFAMFLPNKILTGSEKWYANKSVNNKSWERHHHLLLQFELYGLTGCITEKKNCVPMQHGVSKEKKLLQGHSFFTVYVVRFAKAVYVAT